MRSHACKITRLKCFADLLKIGLTKVSIFFFTFCLPYAKFIMIVLVFLDAIAIARNLSSRDFNVSHLSLQFKTRITKLLHS